MDFTSVEYNNINEKMYVYRHKSGLQAFIIPKKGYSKKYALFSTHYGSIDNKFIVPGEKDVTSVPNGIAHFLEHKLFEQKDGNALDKFSSIGANANAYTGFTKTAYLFSCTDRFQECFDMLINFVQNPYITDESVEKEKGIIDQEIRMYQDNPGWRVFFNLLNALYKNNPVKIDIAGSSESIREINKEILYKCYNTFYHPSNMIICVVGDVNPEEVFHKVEAGIRECQSLPGIQRVFPDEPALVNKDYIEQSLSVSTPIFQIGIKDNPSISKGTECLKREVAIKILLEYIMGRSSKLYSELYNQGLINSSFGFDYTIEDSFAFSIFGGESVNPEKVRDRIIEEIQSVKKEGIDKTAYERIRRAVNGRFIRKLNSVERIANTFISVFFKGVNMFDYVEVYDKITFEYVNKIFKEHFNMDNLSLSIVRPV